ncbi:MAG: hypothetical protein JWN49_444 [Parcubacteria group bacterium]|nr:hypothetical protein [Parcubacteria group bacterium]
MLIVSANYRDRKSPYPWLVRQETQHPRAARAFKTVIATGVKFAASGHYEEGFGCSIIALCDDVQGFDRMPKPHRWWNLMPQQEESTAEPPPIDGAAVPLKFDPYEMIEAIYGHRAIPFTFATLRLNPDRSMLCTAVHPATAKQEAPIEAEMVPA